MHLLRLAFAVSGVTAAIAHGPQVPRRKSLAFGPVHPHARYTTSPEPYLAPASFAGPSDPFTVDPASDPFAVARSFVDSLTPDLDKATTSFVIRSDSYTDDRTGVTHVYVKQLVNGLEVIDGDINLNIKDGHVISYGDSFYRGPPPTADGHASSMHAAYCRSLAQEVEHRQLAYTQRHSQSLQRPLNEDVETSYSEQLGLLNHLHASNCAFLDRDVKWSRDDVSPRAAALMFIIAATPNTQVADDLAANFDKYRSEVTVTPSHHLQDSGPQYTLDGIPDTISPVKARLSYIQVPSGDKTVLKAVWRLEVEMQDNWYDAAVDASEPSHIISVVDWASDSPVSPIPKEPIPPSAAVYNVFPWGVNDPEEGKRSLEPENIDVLASPVGWHSMPMHVSPTSQSRSSVPDGGEVEFINFTTTFGNNVFAHENWEGLSSWIDNYRPDAGERMLFNYTYNPRARPNRTAISEARQYINYTVTQLFYTSNLVHDLYYRYGFDEKSGNFQQYNFGRGGKEGDAVIANAQDGSGFNNANFMTPPDGQNGRCRMYLWNSAVPYRDGDLEAGIVIHELSHGLSTRLTGGPADSSCLGWGESGGMGEGWGDFLATLIRSKEEYSDYPMGAWAANREGGIRNFPYSLNKTINPSTYKTLDQPGYWGVHAIGEVWAEMLWTISQRLIAKHGYSSTLFPPRPLANGTVPEGDFYRPAYLTAAGERKQYVPKHGNTLMIQLVIDAMKLQPCRLGFFEARDAIIQADQVLTGGENFCELWKGFSKRGLGPDAKVEGRTPWGGGIRTNDFALPAICRS